MGTVGLSFGSPTSGAGFDVSSTVSSIMANLQNVETPWKTQLKALESQDTVISSLGRLLSNVSNDISQLTDFTGIMAQKTGSSSNENVLELTSATSAAAAGTHTVTVNSLAQTSSGYLAEVGSASDAVTGSITLQSGSGKAQVITLDSSDNTLTGLASAINASGVGINASVLTDATGSRLSLVSSTSGEAGNIAISQNSLVVGSPNTLSFTGSAGSSTVTSSGKLAAAASLSDSLTGSMSIAVGSGTAAPVTMAAVKLAEGGTTLADLADYINARQGALGVSASVVTNSDNTSSLSLTSLTAGAAGTLTVTSSITDPSTALAYTSTVLGANASLSVDGVNLTSASNTVTNLIPGVTFQLLSTSNSPVQVVIGNDNTEVESTVNQFVSDYNSLVSALNGQEGNDSSGNPEPLFGSPTLSLLQQQLMSSLNTQNPNGGMDPIAANADTTLAGSIKITVGGGATDTVIVGAGTNTANIFYTGGGVNTLAGLADAINAANAGTTLSYTAGSDDSTGTFAAVGSGTALSGSLTLAAGSGTPEKIVIGDQPSTGAAADTLYTGSADNSLSDLADTINSAASLGISAVVTTDSNGLQTMSLSSGNGDALTVTSGVVAAGLGVRAGITTTFGQSTLSLMSQTADAAGALAVTSNLTATSATPLNFKGTPASNNRNAGGTLTAVSNSADLLTGSISIQVGSVPATTVNLNSNNDTLQGLADAINGTSGIRVTASVSSDGKTLSLLSGIAGSAGHLTVTSNILDTTNTTTTPLNYNNSSDVSTLANLGITVSNKDDGSLDFDAGTLDTLLNTDYSGAVGFFQGLNSWGQGFSTMLENAGSSSSSGGLALASKSNNSIESTLNAEVSKEQSLISAQQASLTAELNSANEILQELPSQLQGVNELYSAITGYNQPRNG